MSWKKYGGTNNYEAMSDLTVNNLVADHTISKYDVYSYGGFVEVFRLIERSNEQKVHAIFAESSYTEAS